MRMDRKESFKISGMSCSACAARIEKGLNKLEGIKNANVNYAVEKATVEFEDGFVNLGQIREAVKKLGYEAVEEEDGKQTKIELKITGMSCAACSAKIEKSLIKLKE